MPKHFDKETVNAILDAMDRGKKKETIIAFFDIAPTTADAIRVFRDYVMKQNHIQIAKAIKRRGMIGDNTKTAIMEHYGYELPDGFLEQEESEPDAAPEQTTLPAINQPDYSAFLTGIMAQLAQISVLPNTTTDIGKALLMQTEQLAAINKKMDKLLDIAGAAVANQNAQIQRQDQTQESIKYMVRLMKRG